MDILSEIINLRDNKQDYMLSVDTFLNANKKEIRSYCSVLFDSPGDSAIVQSAISKFPVELVKCIEKYDKNRSPKINGYFRYFIAQRLMGNVGKSSDIKISRYKNRFEDEYGKVPFAEELKQYIDGNTSWHVSLNKIVVYYIENGLLPPEILNEYTSKNDKKKKINIDNVSDYIEPFELYGDQLTKTEQNVMRAWLYDNLKIKDICEKLSLSKSTVSEARKRAKIRLLLLNKNREP